MTFASGHVLVQGPPASPSLSSIRLALPTCSGVALSLHVRLSLIARVPPISCWIESVRDQIACSVASPTSPTCCPHRSELPAGPRRSVPWISLVGRARPHDGTQRSTASRTDRSNPSLLLLTCVSSTIRRTSCAPCALLPRTSRRALLRRQVLRQRVELVADRRSELRIHISHARPCAVASASRSAEPRPRYTVQGAFGALAVVDQIPIMTTPTLTPCVACQHLVSTQSNKCPACGQLSHA